jgi:hypothetical protein
MNWKTATREEKITWLTAEVTDLGRAITILEQQKKRYEEWLKRLKEGR